MDLIDEIKTRRERFEQALAALSALHDAQVGERPDVLRDARIQRFEFTFETFWKLLQAIGRDEGLDAGSPRRALNIALRLGFVDESGDATLAAMIRYRNLTVHTYDETLAREVEDFVVNRAIPIFQGCLSRLDSPGV